MKMMKMMFALWMFFHILGIHFVFLQHVHHFKCVPCSISAFKRCCHSMPNYSSIINNNNPVKTLAFLCIIKIKLVRKTS